MEVVGLSEILVLLVPVTKLHIAISQNTVCNLSIVVLVTKCLWITGVLWCGMAQEIQVPNRLLLCNQASKTAATQVQQIYKVPVCRRSGIARQMGHGNSPCQG